MDPRQRAALALERADLALRDERDPETTAAADDYIRSVPQRPAPAQPASRAQPTPTYVTPVQLATEIRRFSEHLNGAIGGALGATRREIEADTDRKVASLEGRMLVRMMDLERRVLGLAVEPIGGGDAD